MPDPAQVLREKIRVVRPGGTVSAVACFCHSGGLPRYHGRYPLPGSPRIDQLYLKFDRIWRRTVRPRVLNVDHDVLNLDLLWHFQAAGLDDVQINGLLGLVSPGDARHPVEEAAAYALERQRKELENLRATWHEHAETLAHSGFSHEEFEELVAMKEARYEYLQENLSCVREVMEVFAEPLLIVRGTKPCPE